MDQNMDDIVKNFNENGIGLVKGFASKDECKVMIEKMKEIINNTDMKDWIFNFNVTWSEFAPKWQGY